MPSPRVKGNDIQGIRNDAADPVIRGVSLKKDSRKTGIAQIGRTVYIGSNVIVFNDIVCRSSKVDALTGIGRDNIAGRHSRAAHLISGTGKRYGYHPRRYREQLFH